MGEWIKKMWRRQMIEYYSALKKEGNSVTRYNMGETLGHYAK